jgi:hypothetical protein
MKRIDRLLAQAAATVAGEYPQYRVFTGCFAVPGSPTYSRAIYVLDVPPDLNSDVSHRVYRVLEACIGPGALDVVFDYIVSRAFVEMNFPDGCPDWYGERATRVLANGAAGARRPSARPRSTARRTPVRRVASKRAAKRTA